MRRRKCAPSVLSEQIALVLLFSLAYHLLTTATGHRCVVAARENNNNKNKVARIKSGVGFALPFTKCKASLGQQVGLRNAE